MAKKCDCSRNCYWGDAFNPGYCAYDINMREDGVCPKLIDKWDSAPAEVMAELIVKARIENA